MRKVEVTFDGVSRVRRHASLEPYVVDALQRERQRLVEALDHARREIAREEELLARARDSAAECEARLVEVERALA